ncbi:MAG: hypothetical protein ABSA33_03045, partial [Candidatus Micrarchaeaceae archaeon]
MSSPTINSPQMSFPSLEEINNLIRAIINDSQAGLTNTPGEGQIFTDNPLVSPFVLPMLNSSIREIYRELRNVGDPQLIFDNYVILGLPILDSPTNGPGECDPTVQTTLSTVGYFDGVQLWPNFQLPSNMLYPTKLWERCTGTNDNFEPMHQVQDGLPRQQQNQVLGKWEWRQNVINFMGATTKRDIRMRFYGSLPQFFSTTMDYNSTFVPIQDSADYEIFRTEDGKQGYVVIYDKALKTVDHLVRYDEINLPFIEQPILVLKIWRMVGSQWVIGKTTMI